MEPAKRVFVIRHGESKWNVLRKEYPGEDERYHPRMWTVDCDITELGVRQAKQAGLDLVTQNIDSIDLLIISPLRRALQTAQHVVDSFPGGGPKEVYVSTDAAEVMVDPCDIGSIPLQLCQEFPKWSFSHLQEHWWHGGLSPEDTLALMIVGKNLEGDDDAKRRIQSLKSLLRQTDARSIVVVCHGDLIWWLTRKWKDGEASGEEAKNGELIEITSYVNLLDTT
jgi:broad specificity phosphatase PhoE